MKVLPEVSHYKVGEISKMLGLSVSGLRLYERRGIIKPRRTLESGYRMYNFMDIACIVMNKFFMSLGFSMNESVSLYQAEGPEAIVPQLQRRENEIEEEIRLKKLELEHLREYREKMANAREWVGKCRVTNSPALYCLRYHDEGTLVIGEAEKKEFARWIAHLPFVRITSVYPLENFIARKPHITVHLSITCEWAEKIGFDPGPYSFYIPSYRSVETMAYEPSATFTYDCLDHVYDYMDRHSMKPAHNPFCFCDLMLDNQKGADYLLDRYRQTWVPVE